MLLDEIDKMGSDFRDGPASALLEFLDPEQNSHFVDHYLEVEQDLSEVIFIAAANSYNLPRALIDRMEIINISGYVEEEKLQIAKNYLIPKQLKMHEMKENELTIDDGAILELIRYYTKESISSANHEEYLGVRKYNFGLAQKKIKQVLLQELLIHKSVEELLTIEALSFHGKGDTKTTGKFGNVMKNLIKQPIAVFTLELVVLDQNTKIIEILISICTKAGEIL